MCVWFPKRFVVVVVVVVGFLTLDISQLAGWLGLGIQEIRQLAETRAILWNWRLWTWQRRLRGLQRILFLV